jgi:hypothetical protein
MTYIECATLRKKIPFCSPSPVRRFWFLSYVEINFLTMTCVTIWWWRILRDDRDTLYAVFWVDHHLLSGVNRGRSGCLRFVIHSGISRTSWFQRAERASVRVKSSAGSRTLVRIFSSCKFLLLIRNQLLRQSLIVRKVRKSKAIPVTGHGAP